MDLHDIILLGEYPKSLPEVETMRIQEFIEWTFRRIMWGFASLCILGVGTVLASNPMRPLDFGEVRVGGEIGHRIDLTIEENLLALDVEEDFLKPFRERTAADGFIGLGMFLDGLVKMAAYSQDERVINLKNRVVEETLSLQEPDGYLGMLKPESRMWVLWDAHEMAYLIHALTSDYKYFGNEESLAAACKTANYLMERWEAEPDRIPGGGQIAYHMAITGLDTGLLELYSHTQDERFLRFCTESLDLPGWDSPIVRGRWGAIEGHAYAYMSRCMAQFRLNRLRPDPALTEKTKNVLDFLTKEDGLVITGTCGYHECWHDTHEGGHNLAETCTTAYLIRFLGNLMQDDPNSLYGDIMERAIYNALFAAQSPDGRRIRYYTPFEVARVYYEKDTYCCPNNYRRILPEIPGLIYFKNEEGILVNLYAQSDAAVKLGDRVTVNLNQETDYPNSGKVEMSVEPSKPAEFTLSFRIPRWCENPSVRVNEEPVSAQVQPGSFFEVKREWRPGDRVVLDFPMELRFVKGRKTQAGRVAVMRGPVLFTLSTSRNEELGETNLRMMVIKPETLEGPFEDDSVREGGLSCKVEAWKPDTWYPFAPTEFKLTLTEFPDPEGRSSYFLVPNPEEDKYVEDELILN